MTKNTLVTASESSNKHFSKEIPKRLAKLPKGKRGKKNYRKRQILNHGNHTRRHHHSPLYSHYSGPRD